jgi:hypothetical protein
MLALASAITTLATTLVTDDRLPDVAAPATVDGQAIYSRGRSEFAQALDKVAPDRQVVQALEDEGKLANPDPNLTALLQAASPQAATDAQAALNPTPTATPTQPANGQAVLQQALQSGAAQLYQTSRLGLHLNRLS